MNITLDPARLLGLKLDKMRNCGYAQTVAVFEVDAQTKLLLSTRLEISPGDYRMDIIGFGTRKGLSVILLQ